MGSFDFLRRAFEDTFSIIEVAVGLTGEAQGSIALRAVLWAGDTLSGSEVIVLGDTAGGIGLAGSIMQNVWGFARSAETWGCAASAIRFTIFTNVVGSVIVGAYWTAHPAFSIGEEEPICATKALFTVAVGAEEWTV